MSVSLDLLTDEAILDYTRSDGHDHVLYSHLDLNLKFERRIQPIPGGVYDDQIFGSPYEDRCTCGNIKHHSTEPCPNCGARVFTREEALRRFARIELPFYYLNDLRFDIFKGLFDEIFSDSVINLDFEGDTKSYGIVKGSTRKLGMKVFDSCQFEYNKTKKELKITNVITDLSKCSYEGLIEIIKDNFPERLPDFMKLINRYYLVQPAIMRPPTLAYRGGHKVMGVHKLSAWYSLIISFCCAEDVKSNPVNYTEAMAGFNTPGEKARYNALLRSFINSGKKEATELLNSSKENLARDLYKVRTKNSARCPIIPATDLAIDEIGVPDSIAYEMCRDGFCNYLEEKLNFTRKEALVATKFEALNPETQKLFKEYAEDQVVLTFLLVRSGNIPVINPGI